MDTMLLGTVKTVDILPAGYWISLVIALSYSTPSILAKYGLFDATFIAVREVHE